jgi:hypothetical protein
MTSSTPHRCLRLREPEAVRLGRRLRVGERLAERLGAVEGLALRLGSAVREALAGA